MTHLPQRTARRAPRHRPPARRSPTPRPSRALLTEARDARACDIGHIVTRFSASRHGAVARWSPTGNRPATKLGSGPSPPGGSVTHWSSHAARRTELRHPTPDPLPLSAVHRGLADRTPLASAATAPARRRTASCTSTEPFRPIAPFSARQPTPTWCGAATPADDRRPARRRRRDRGVDVVARLERAAAPSGRAPPRALVAVGACVATSRSRTRAADDDRTCSSQRARRTRARRRAMRRSTGSPVGVVPVGSRR